MKCNHSSDNKPDEYKLCVSGVPIFNHLSFDEMQKVVQSAHSKNYLKGEMIFQPGDLTEQLLIIHTGRVKIYRVSELGKEQLLRILEPGDFIGELSLFTSDTSANYAEAMSNTEICVIHRKDLQGMLVTHPEISLKVLEEIGKRLKEAEMTIERLSLQDAEKRVASYLIEQISSATNSEDGIAPITIVLPMSKKDLSSYIGTTQETLSRRLTTFQERGWIKQSGQRNIIILNKEELANIAH
ncbi:Crp/Fnr family transcriptional regulator [Neobacillus sp. FSL H8-0543]|uniref:Crp/Fnr family transcriptional regulator n=1 Tax=Neobacillus sp. FSL H8-0543 TaxID=2954672 RepID=UPI0031587A2D